MKKNSKIAYVAPEQCKLLPKDWGLVLSLLNQSKKCEWGLGDLEEYDYVLIMGSLAHKYIDSGLKI